MEIPRYGRGPRLARALGVSLVSLDAPFELQVRRETYDDPISVRQAFHRPGGTAARGPARGHPRRLDGSRSLPPFRPVQARGPRSDPGARRLPRRVADGAGRRHRAPSTRPTHGMRRSTRSRWGRSGGSTRGGRSTPLLWNAHVRLPDGRYVAKVSIAPRYQTLFDIAPEDAKVRIVIRIRSRSGCDFCGAPAAPEGTAFRRALTPATITADPDPATLPDLVALPSVRDRHRPRSGSRLPPVRRGRVEPWTRLLCWWRGSASPARTGWTPTSTSRRTASSSGAPRWARSISIIGTDTSTGTSSSSRAIGCSTPLRSRSGARKQAFCLAPTDPIDLTVDGAVWRPEEIGFSQCGSETSTWIREVLPAGWGDTYFQGVPGQSFDITDLPNGTYWIEVRANPGRSSVRRRSRRTTSSCAR